MHLKQVSENGVEAAFTPGEGGRELQGVEGRGKKISVPSWEQRWAGGIITLPPTPTSAEQHPSPGGGGVGK